MGKTVTSRLSISSLILVDVVYTKTKDDVVVLVVVVVVVAVVELSQIVLVPGVTVAFMKLEQSCSIGRDTLFARRARRQLFAAQVACAMGTRAAKRTAAFMFTRRGTLWSWVWIGRNKKARLGPCKH